MKKRSKVVVRNFADGTVEVSAIGQLETVTHVVHPTKVSFIKARITNELRRKERNLMRKYSSSGFACTPFEVLSC